VKRFILMVASWPCSWAWGDNQGLLSSFVGQWQVDQGPYWQTKNPPVYPTGSGSFALRRGTQAITSFNSWPNPLKRQHMAWYRRVGS